MKSITRISVTLEGITPIMFDRYAGDNKTELAPEDKLYLDDKRGLVLPSMNLSSFLSAENTTSVCKRFLDSREYKKTAQAFGSYITIKPFLIPITRNDEQIIFEGFGKNGIEIHKSVARLPKGIPNPKVRPVVDCPWSLSFEMHIIENNEFNFKLLEDLIRKGGVAMGLGTFRGTFGKFEVTNWEIE